MLKTVSGGSRYVTVHGGMPAHTYINSSSGYMNVGDVRYNVQMQRLEVYDGQMWLEISTGHASVGLTPDAEYALDWATRKMAEEAELDRLAASNATIADLVEQKKALDHKIKVIQILTKEEVKVGTN
jgi:hypothetical protein